MSEVVHLEIKELDGFPDVFPVKEIRVSNGTLTDLLQGIVQLTTGGGGGTSDHASLSHLNWSAAGHTFDTDLDIGNYTYYGAQIELANIINHDPMIYFSNPSGDAGIRLNPYGTRLEIGASSGEVWFGGNHLTNVGYIEPDEIHFVLRANDPSSPTSGVSWYRTDLQQFLALIGGSKYRFLMAPATGTYKVYPAEYDAGNSGSTKTLDFANGESQHLNLTANCTVTLSSPTAGGAFVIRITKSGSYTIAWPASVKWPTTDGAPAFTSATTCTVNFYSDGTYWYGSYKYYA